MAEDVVIVAGARTAMAEYVGSFGLERGRRRARHGLATAWIGGGQSMDIVEREG